MPKTKTKTKIRAAAKPARAKTMKRTSATKRKTPMRKK